LWHTLLANLDWAWKSLNKRVPLKYYKYSVGQPMGAYSSWAMLALTHHVIVRCAALNSGIQHFADYAILGDDIVIANKLVADEYLKLMGLLGVSINLNKSLISTEFAEFAKRWMGLDNLNLSPIGAGLILRTVRNKFFLASLLAEMYSVGLINSLDATLVTIRSLPSHWKGQKWNAL
jgi:hypothetical protein